MQNIKILEFGKMNNQLKTNLDINSEKFKQNSKKFIELINEYKNEEQKIELGGGAVKIQKQHDKGRMTARERISYLLDNKPNRYY